MKLLNTLFKFGLTFILIVGAGDLFLRATGITHVYSAHLDTVLGRVPNESNYLFFNEGFGIGRFNQYNYIGKAYSPERAPNTVRVAVIGDSFVEAFQVFERHHFITLAEKRLAENYEQQEVEILNFGRSGFDLSTMYAYQKNYVERFSPDLIVYVISDGDLSFERRPPLMASMQIESDSLVVSKPFSPEIVRQFQRTSTFKNNSALANMLSACKRTIQQGQVGNVLLGKFYSLFERKSVAEPISKTAAPKDIPPVISKIIQALDPEKVVFMARSDNPLPVEFLKSLRSEGFPVLQLEDKFQTLIAKGIHPNEWKVTGKVGHWNHPAHEVLGDELADIVLNFIQSKP